LQSASSNGHRLCSIPSHVGDDPRPTEIGFPFSKTEAHLHLPAQFIFDRSTTGRIGPLDSTLNVVRVTAVGLVKLDFDLA
jgi:hypothetical protein